MLDVIKNALGYLKFSDDEEDYDDYDEYEEDDEPQERKLFAAQPKVAPKIEERKPMFTQQERTSVKEEQVEPKRFTSRMERTTNNKIVPIRTTPRGLEVCIMKPTAFEDSQDICDMLLTGRAAVVNLEGFDPDEAQRVMDFISGCVYAINGKLHQISRYIFIFSPDTIDISGDYLELVSDDFGFGVPTLNKEF